jgi:hypothetical protein
MTHTHEGAWIPISQTEYEALCCDGGLLQVGELPYPLVHRCDRHSLVGVRDGVG